METLDEDTYTPPIFPAALPEDEHQYAKVRVMKESAQTGLPTITAYLYTEDDIGSESRASEQFRFSVTQDDEPKTCGYKWNAGELPSIVIRAIYKFGYAIENTRTFPAYTEETTLLMQAENLLRQKYDALSTLDIPIIPALFEQAADSVRAAQIILRGRLVTTEEEWMHTCRYIIDELTGSPDTQEMYLNNLDDLNAIARYIQPVVEAVIEETRADGSAPSDVADISLLRYETRFVGDVEETEEYLYAYLYNPDHLERFVFEKTGSETCVARRYEGKPAHTNAITMVNEETSYSVQGHPDLSRWQSDTHELIDTLITTLEKLTGEHTDDPWFSDGVLLFAADSLYDLQLGYAMADALGRERTREVAEQAGVTGDLTHDINAFLEAVGSETAQKLEAEHDFLSRAVQQSEDNFNQSKWT